MQKSKMVVADVYRLGRQGGKFVQAGRVLERTGAVVTRAWAEQHNNDIHNCLYFDIDEDKSEEWLEKRDEGIERRKMEKEKGNIDVTKLAKALLGDSKEDEPKPAKKTTRTRKKTVKPKEDETND
jgi:hypothetical protein